MKGAVERQLDEINNKDDLIKWLVNSYFEHTHIIKKHELVSDEVLEVERQQVKSKADEIMKGQ